MAGEKAKLDIWHEGERHIQASVGAEARMAEVGKRVVRDHMPDQHRDFYKQLPFIVLGSVDRSDDAWATFVTGQPGFMSSPSPTILDIAANPDPSDPASQGLTDGGPVGLLGIELHTRRRNRMNGVVSHIDSGLRVDVDQSFGNCPRYIQLRDFGFVRDPAAAYGGEIEESGEIDVEARTMIEAADSFFVASYADREDRRQVDVSHRGGKTGFVRVSDDGLLTIPDFDGNLFFATLGNIYLNGKAGLIFVDFATGDVVQMTGDAEVILDSPEIAAFQGAERLWTFRARRIVRRRAALALRWRMQDDGWSPASLMTGDWDQAADRLRASELASRWRPFRVTDIVEESASIRSFHLQPGDGAGLLPFLGGQHLPIRLLLPGETKPLIRTYTLSAAPSDGFYRISVKRDGPVSQHLHERISIGDIIEARAPAGGFTIDAAEKRPAVLIGAGVGITPMLAMARHIVYEGLRKQSIRPTMIIHAARTKGERPFEREFGEIVTSGQGAVKLIRLLSDVTDARADLDYDRSGRVDMTLLTQALHFNDYDFYLCGPPAFTQAIYDGLRGLNVADNRIHAEAFGPSSLVRSAPAGTDEAPTVKASEKDVPILFTKSLKEARWTPASGSLLEMAEARGLEPEFSCREGSCGTCKTKLLAGKVAHIRPPGVALAEDEVLICSAVPAEQGSSDARLELDL